MPGSTAFLIQRSIASLRMSFEMRDVSCYASFTVSLATQL